MAENITRKETLEGVRVDDPGSGIYWFVDPKGLHEQVFVPNITRARAEELAEDFANPRKQSLDAYRWVPDSVANPAILTMQSCSGTICSSNVQCVDNACKCINGECRRK